jgi:hypothetical protein
MSMNPELPRPEPASPAVAPEPGASADSGRVPPGPEPSDRIAAAEPFAVAASSPAPTAEPVPTTEPTPVTPGPAPATPGEDPSAVRGGLLWSNSSSRDARRAERHAQREAHRAERGIGGAIWGVVLVLIGAGILASELIPGFDWDVAWPATLVAFGILLIAASIRRAPAGS